MVKSRRVERPEHMLNMVEKKKETQHFARKETTWKIKRRCGGNIKMDLKEIG
jgi:hypothetical protein